MRALYERVCIVDGYMAAKPTLYTCIYTLPGPQKTEGRGIELVMSANVEVIVI